MGDVELVGKYEPLEIFWMLTLITRAVAIYSSNTRNRKQKAGQRSRKTASFLKMSRKKGDGSSSDDAATL